MKTISVIAFDVNNSETQHPLIHDKCNVINSFVDLYIFTNKKYQQSHIKECIEVNGNICQQINDLLNKIMTDYVIFIPNDYSFEYDDALMDAVTLAENNDITCFSTQYKGDEVNKYDSKYKNYHINPIFSEIFSRPSAFIACIYSREIYKSMNLYGNSIFDIMINGLIFSLFASNKYAFVPLHILHCDAMSIDIDKKVNVENQIDNFINSFPLFKADYQRVLYNVNLKQTEHEVVLEKLKKSYSFKMLMSFRKFLKVIGFYNKKAEFKHKKYLQQVRKKDEQFKLDIAAKIEKLPFNMLKRNNDESDIVVSLTTHGKRLAESAPYGIYSLFTQTVLPNRIVISINKDDWNEDNLPPLIKRLMQSGLEVIFCRDVRSHTKFLPALERFPNNPIITVDDDMCYDEHMVEELVTAYNKSDRKTIFCRQGTFPKKRNSKYMSYMQWEDSINFTDECQNKFTQNVSPYGVYGVIYPPCIFDNEIFNSDVFLKLAPHTDDIWFWLMEIRRNIKAQVVMNSKTKNDYNVSLLEYLNENESSALYFQNCLNGRNDKEMYALLDYYGMN